MYKSKNIYFISACLILFSFEKSACSGAQSDSVDLAIAKAARTMHTLWLAKQDPLVHPSYKGFFEKWHLCVTRECQQLTGLKPDCELNDTKRLRQEVDAQYLSFPDRVKGYITFINKRANTNPENAFGKNFESYHSTVIAPQLEAFSNNPNAKDDKFVRCIVDGRELIRKRRAENACEGKVYPESFEEFYSKEIEPLLHRATKNS